MDCKEFENHLQDYLDNDTSASIAQAIEEHLNQCTACRCELDAYKKTSLLVQLRNVPQPDESYWEKTFDSIQAKMAASILEMPTKTTADSNNKVDNFSLVRKQNWTKRISYFISVAAMMIFIVAGYWWSNLIADKPDEEFNTVIVVEPGWRVIPGSQTMHENFEPDADFSRFSGAAMGVISPVSQGLQAEAFIK